MSPVANQLRGVSELIQKGHPTPAEEMLFQLISAADPGILREHEGLLRKTIAEFFVRRQRVALTEVLTSHLAVLETESVNSVEIRDDSPPFAQHRESPSIDRDRRAQIRTFCATRKIDTLVHFTRLENLHGIAENGLLPRSVLEKGGHRVVFNDDTRIDGRKDAVCLSISFPNYKMFYKYRKATPDAAWVVLLIRPEVLWELDCAFCWANASCSTISRLPPALLKETNSLAKMFSDQCEVSGVNRAACDIPGRYPTNPQAEVLVFSGVPLSCVTAAYFRDQGESSKILPPQGTHLTVGVMPHYFEPRCDWQVWKPDAENNSGELWQDAPSSVPF